MVSWSLNSSSVIIFDDLFWLFSLYKCHECSVPSGERFQVSVPWLKKGWEALIYWFTFNVETASTYSLTYDVDVGWCIFNSSGVLRSADVSSAVLALNPLNQEAVAVFTSDDDTLGGTTKRKLVLCPGHVRVRISSDLALKVQGRSLMDVDRMEGLGKCRGNRTWTIFWKIGDK